MAVRIKTSNILVFYSVYSFLFTVTITALLSFILIKNIETRIIHAHSDLYKSIVEAIPSNYSEILSALSVDSGMSGHDSAETEGHGSSGHSEEPEHELRIWSHFQTDLMQIPAVRQMRVFDLSFHEVWSYKNDQSPLPREYPAMISERDKGESSFHIMESDPYYIIHYNIPISYNSGTVGIVEITEVDSGLNELLTSSKEMISIVIGLGGIALYLILFVLFSKSYRDQRTAISHLDKSQSLTIHTMSLLAELRDSNTGSHIVRTSRYCSAVAKALSRSRPYSKYIDKSYIEDIERSAPLHDIGKVGIPDSILNKPGKLADDEFEIIKKHPRYGADILKNAVESLDFRNYFEIGYQVVLHHHENWDGTGYPEGLKGEEIPLSARIMAIADVYDALRTQRPYKEPFTHSRALEIISGESGSKFDPDIVKAFLSISEEIEKISNQ